ncbi:MAG: Pr6Pr family membrane protein [Defluviitaleaceae bacterium]|nr:Pr6Pr family membrane protein [Defluviitaleaceae bacterium]
MPIKENAHKLYLLISAGLIMYGIIMGLIGRGQIHLLLDIADNTPIHFHALKTFTYQSNILLVIGFLTMLVLYKSKVRHYISTSIMLATGLTGLVYNFLLVPFAQAPLPFFNFENFSTHVLAMVLPLLNYLIFEDKGLLNQRHILVGMIFPIVYWAVFVTIGERISFVPYFFMNPGYVGWATVFAWFGALLAIFSGLGFLLVLYDKSRIIK